MFTSHSKLAIAILIYYVLALPFAVWVCVRHGFGRHAGWFYLLSMGIVRIVGAIITLVADQHPSIGLYITAAIFNSIGLVPLILALMGMMKRVNDGIHHGRVGPRAFQLIHIATLVALILAIVSGTESSPTNQPSTLHNAQTLRKASAALLLVSAILNALIVCYMVIKIRTVQPNDRILVWAALLSVPFLLVRVMYIMLIGFDSSNAKFNPQSPNIYVQAFMQILMECICFALYLGAGLSVAKMEAGQYAGAGSELLRGGIHDESAEQARQEVFQAQTSGRVRKESV